MFTESDLKNLRSFSRIIDQLDFVIKGEAVVQTALLKQWFMELDKKIIEAINQGKEPTQMIGEPKPLNSNKAAKGKK